MLNHLTTAQINGRWPTPSKLTSVPQLLLLDELGYLPIDKRGADLLFQVVAARYESGSIVITTNRAFREWGKLFDVDNTLATAMIDRLMHHGEAIVIQGDSYRMKDKDTIRPTQRLTLAGAPAVGGVVPPARELRVVSGTGSPAHPRAARHARGLLRAADRFVDGSKSPGPGPPLPAAPIDELCPSTRAILARLSAIPDAPFGGGPIRSRPAHRPRTTPQQLRATPRQATTPGPPSLRALTRVPSCATRARCALQTIARWPKWLRLPAQNWLCFFDRYQRTPWGSSSSFAVKLARASKRTST